MTVDKDIARQARRFFPVLGMNMSAFFEYSMAQFLQTLAPFEPLLDDIEAGKADPAQLKIAMRAYMANASTVVGEHLADFGRISAEVNQKLEEGTDKK